MNNYLRIFLIIAIFSLQTKLNSFDKFVIDGVVNGVGRLVQYSGRQLRLLQSGQVGGYVLIMVIGLILFFVIQFFLKK